MLAWPHPDLRLNWDFQMCEPFRRHEAAVAHATCEAGLLRSKQNVPHGGVDAVGTHQHVNFDVGSVLELCRDAVAMVHKAGQAVPNMHAVGGQGCDECSQDV